jgi:protein-tyrosine phosphatase
MTACCSEATCRRHEPLRLYRGLSRRWYVATRTRDGAATEKHALPDDTQAQLTDMAEAHAWLAAATEVAGGRQQILDALGITITKKDA